jgi:uncharacterized membrane protein YfcA
MLVEAWFTLTLDILQFKLLPLIPMLLVLSFAGTAVGKYLLQFISEVRFQRVVLGLILVVGISTMVITIVN